MSTNRALSDSSPLAVVTAARDHLPAVIHVVVAGVPGCDAASVAVLRDGAPLAVVASHLPVRWLTELQYEEASGPCWEATVADQPVAVDDILDQADADPPDDDEAGWRSIARACGFTAALAIPLTTEDDSAAVLQLCTRTAPGWPLEARTAASFLADYVGRHLPLPVAGPELRRR